MIAILSTTHGDGTGADVMLEHLLRALKQTTGRSDILVVSPLDSRAGRVAKDLSIPNVELSTRRDSLVENARAVMKCREALRSCRVFHAWHSRGYELAWWLGRQFGGKTSATIHDTSKARAYSGSRRFLMRFFAGRLSRLVCVSQAVRNVWSAEQIKAPLIVIRNGIADVDRRRPLSRVPVVGFAGMHSPMKGFSHVTLWADALSSCDVQWNLYGDPPTECRKNVQDLLARNPRIAWRGKQPPPVIFSEIDILVHPSTEFDSLPTVLIEAARAGIPAVASDVGGSREIVDHGETGYLFPSGSPGEGLRYLEHVIRDEALRRRMGNAARRCFEQEFQVFRMADAYDRLWESLAAEEEKQQEQGSSPPVAL